MNNKVHKAIGMVILLTAIIVTKNMMLNANIPPSQAFIITLLIIASTLLFSDLWEHSDKNKNI